MKKEVEESVLLENLFDGVYFVDKNRTIISWNQGAQQITGFKAEEVIHKHCYENLLNHIDENGTALCFDGCPLHQTLVDGEVRMNQVYLQHKDGHRVPVRIKTIPTYDDQGLITGAFEIFTEIQNEKSFRSSLERLRKEASEDALTGIPNRKYLLSLIESKCREYKAVGIPFGLCFIDIDHFKTFNDTYGHEIGDEILKLLVRSISLSLRKNDIIGRLGGEEFVVLVSDVDEEGLHKVSEKIRSLIEHSKLRHLELELSMTISIGATLIAPKDSSESILQRADLLMYHSKNAGRNKVTLG
jgi:diguanylate cyclase (GGDEF)-like protein/PAS domain S-box-containing protein